MKKIIIIETSDVGANYTAEAVKELGYTPIFICNINNYQGDTKKQILQHQWYQADTNNFDSVLDVINTKLDKNIEGIISFLDSKLSISVKLSEALSLKSLDKQIIKLSDKGYVYSLIKEFSPRSLIFNKNNIDYQQLEKKFNKVSKILIKPTIASGALGMFTIDSRDKIKDISLMISKQDKKLEEGDWICQEFIPGKLCSLEGYCHNSKVNFIGFTGRQKIKNTESISEFPFDIEETLAEKAKFIVKTLAKRAGYQHGYFHCEFIFTKDNCYLIDSNFGRIAGAGIAPQIALSYGKKPIDVYKHVINISLFHTDNPDFYCEKIIKKTISINYGIKNAGILSKVTLPSTFQSIHTQLLDSGTKVSAMGNNNWDWVGLAVGYKECLLKEIDQFSISTDSEESLTPYFKPTEPISNKNQSCFQAEVPSAEEDSESAISFKL